MEAVEAEAAEVISVEAEASEVISVEAEAIKKLRSYEGTTREANAKKMRSCEELKAMA